MFPKVKGVADNFFDMPYWSGVIKKIEAHLQSYNFSAIEIPILEHVSLFQRGLGYETDVVSKQMFIMQSKHTDADDTKNTDAICLRPEGTAGTIRAFLDVQSKVSLPANVYCYGPMFRYERPQKGRLREFHQFNMEMLGNSSILYDAHYIKMLHILFTQTLGMQNVILKINFLGQPQDRKKFSAALIAFLKPQSNLLCNVCQTRIETNPLRILDCKSETCQKLCLNGPKLADFFSDETKQEWQELQNSLQELSVTFSVDDHLVRGLDYYNKTVFEFVSVDLGAQNTFCGGGRYDGLAEQLGSKTMVPAFGCAIGMERLILILQAQQQNLAAPAIPLVCIIPLSEAQNKLALHIADFIHNQTATKKLPARAVQILFDGSKMKNKMNQANNLKATWTLLLGDDEQKNNTVTIKNMITGDQKTVLQTKIMESL